MKPRLFKSGQMWVCVGCEVAGGGVTPVEAYEKWDANLQWLIELEFLANLNDARLARVRGQCVGTYK